MTLQAPVSTPDEIQHLATGLADQYIQYLTIDTSEQKKNTHDSMDECLAHLEELKSVLDSFNSNDIVDFFKHLMVGTKELDKLYEQIDALDQYTYVVNRLLDQLELAIKKLGDKQGMQGNKIRQIMDLIPKISLTAMPRLNILGTTIGAPSELVQSVDEAHESTSEEEILAQIRLIEASIHEARKDLNKRLGVNTVEPAKEAGPSNVQREPAEELDSSWQELL